MGNIYVKSKLISFYKNPKYLYFRTKAGSSTITSALLGKHIYIYNGKKWLCKKIDNHYYIDKSISSLKNTNTKEISIYKKKKKKKNKK